MMGPIDHTGAQILAQGRIPHEPVAKARKERIAEEMTI